MNLKILSKAIITNFKTKITNSEIYFEIGALENIYVILGLTDTC